MQRIKWELEDLSLKISGPPLATRKSSSKLEAKHQEYEDFMRRIQIQIDDRLKELNIEHIVYGRDEASLLHLPEDVQPEQEPGRDLRPVAFRVIVNTVGDCYNVLGGHP